MDHQTLQGQIVSWHLDGDEGVWRSREDFIITRHANGGRVLRAFCQLYDHNIVRDVMTGIDEEMHPRDANVRVVVDGALLGTAWYTFTEGEIHCEADVEQGRLSRTESWQGATRGVGTHALPSDAWLLASLDLSGEPGRRTLDEFPIPSTHHLGATAPQLEFVSAEVDYLGDEEVAVTAGTFSCHHLQFVATSNEHPPNDVWVSADGEFIFVKEFVGGDWNLMYELRELARE